jgi:hypothetical protein
MVLHFSTFQQIVLFLKYKPVLFQTINRGLINKNMFVALRRQESAYLPSVTVSL